jgi:hypothetical protein
VPGRRPAFWLLVRLQPEPSDPADDRHVLVDVRDGPLGQNRNISGVIARAVIRLFILARLTLVDWLFMLEPPQGEVLCGTEPRLILVKESEWSIDRS